MEQYKEMNECDDGFEIYFYFDAKDLRPGQETL
jgi:hypothetical protein